MKNLLKYTPDRKYDIILSLQSKYRNNVFLNIYLYIFFIQIAPIIGVV